MRKKPCAQSWKGAAFEMKNDEQMYQSVLSRYERYLETRRARARMIRRTVPVLACFCLAVVLGVGYRHQFLDLPPIPTVPPVTEETAITSFITTTMTVTETAAQTSTKAKPIPTTAGETAVQSATQTKPIPTISRETAVQSATKTRPSSTSADATTAQESEQTHRVSSTVHTTSQQEPAVSTATTEEHVTVTTTVAKTLPATEEPTIATVTVTTTVAKTLPATEEPTVATVTVTTGVGEVTTGSGSASTQTTTTTETTVFVPDPDTALLVREQMEQLIRRYELQAHTWVADAAAYPQYADMVVIEYNDEYFARFLKRMVRPIDRRRYLIFVYYEEPEPDEYE